jgi:hypothetical protein
MPLDLKLFCEAWAQLIQTGTTTVAFEWRVPGAQLAQIMKLNPNETSDAHFLPLLRRFFCHSVICKLPDEALSETEERLAEILEDSFPRQSSPHLSKKTWPGVLTAQQGLRHSRPEIELED